MNELLKKKLQELAAKEGWSDDDPFVIDDYAGGNVDDAYYAGTRDGERMLARELLKQFGQDRPHE